MIFTPNRQVRRGISLERFTSETLWVSEGSFRQSDRRQPVGSVFAARLNVFGVASPWNKLATSDAMPVAALVGGGRVENRVFWRNDLRQIKRE